MSHFDFSAADFSSAGSLIGASGVNQTNVFEGNVVDPISTSWATSPTDSKGLTSWSVSNILQGAPLQRSERQVLNTLNQRISGSSSMFLQSAKGGVDSNLASGTSYDVMQGRIANEMGAMAGQINVGDGGGEGRSSGSAANGNAVRSGGYGSGDVASLLRWGEQHLNKPYSQTQGKAPNHQDPSTSGRYGPDMYDCSGFSTSAMFFGLGKQLNTGSNATYTGIFVDGSNSLTALGKQIYEVCGITVGEKQPGDLFIHHDHMGFFYGLNDNGGEMAMESGGTGSRIINETLYMKNSRTFWFRSTAWPDQGKK